MNKVIPALLISALFMLLITACNNEPAKASCHITSGGQEYHYPDFSKKECDKEVQSLMDKGIIDAQATWKISDR